MANPVIPTNYALILCSFRHAQVSRSAAITFGVHDESGALTPLETLTAAIDVASATLRTEVDNQVTIGPGTATFQLAGGEYASVTGGGSRPGAASYDSVPSNTAVLVQKRTDAPGRRNRGRFFMPWSVSETFVGESGIIVQPTVDALQDACDDFLAGLATAGIPMHLFHGAGTGVSTPTPVTSLAVQSIVATQRLRMRS